jgi:16S rRNA (uracil1498-N3)-methyltransferase
MARHVTLLTGPEGGFSHQERDVAKAAGFIPVRMGSRILRTETAALAALAAVQMLWGDFGTQAMPALSSSMNLV